MTEKYLMNQTSCDKGKSAERPVILTFIGHYLPGYKAGGILRTIVNTVDHLCDELEFKIVTRDRDLGDNKPYDDIKINQWQFLGNAMVYYLSPLSATIKSISKLILSTKHDVLYLNSFFDRFTIKVLLIRKYSSKSFKPVIVAPWGEFAKASLNQKYLKKAIFIQLVRFLKLYDNVTWRASSEFEKNDIMKSMKTKSEAIHITGDFPIKNNPETFHDVTVKPAPDDRGLKLVFLSRIARVKNLDYALKVLKKVNARVIFDIYGPIENKTYWKECQELIIQLPANVIVNYLGSVDPDKVINIFGQYDLFLFPTAGEAYGHVIAECLISGTPVLVSNETPWRNLQADGLGWDVDLSEMDSFAGIIEKLSALNYVERLNRRNIVKAKIMERLLSPDVLMTNRQLFKRH